MKYYRQEKDLLEVLHTGNRSAGRNTQEKDLLEVITDRKKILLEVLHTGNRSWKYCRQEKDLLEVLWKDKSNVGIIIYSRQLKEILEIQHKI